MKELGYGKAYRYAHDEPEGYAAGETYFPDGMANPGYYQPVQRGLEIRIAEKLAHLRELDKKHNRANCRSGVPRACGARTIADRGCDPHAACTRR